MKIIGLFIAYFILTAFVLGEMYRYNGEWIPIVNYFHGKPDGRYYCSVCRRVETKKGIYCPECGARMDGGNSNA